MKLYSKDMAMEISTSSNVFTIKGNIKTVNNYQSIKNSMDTLASQHKNITVNIDSSLSITSSVIGYFNKLILKDKINIQMNIGNEQLIELLDDLNLSTVFKVRKV
jgi:hypothetical protein